MPTLQSLKQTATKRADVEVPKQELKPRICMPTTRNFGRRAFQCGLYECQDVLTETDAVDMICLEPGAGFRFKERWQRRLMYRDVSRSLIYLNPGFRKVRLNQDYDLFIAVCQNYRDLLCLNAIDGWQDRCKTSVCWIEELWAAQIPYYKYWLHALRRFDHVFIGYKDTVAPLSNAIGRACHWLPAAVDALRFSPYPVPPARVIDVYSVGRRNDAIHRALLQAAERGEIFYIYDTLQGADMQVYSHKEHRNHYANITKRSRYFMVAPAKTGEMDETRGQVDVGYRFYEGAAAGAVLLGQPPSCDSFRELFPWSDAVVQIQPDGSDVRDVLAGLASEPERVSAISRRNAVELVLRHDWVYRWKEMFRVAGIEPSPRMVERERRLRDLAEMANTASQGTLASRKV